MSDQRRRSLFPPEELRLVLLGTLGCGKTLSADTILGQPSSTSPSSSSRTCQLRRGTAEGRRLAVVEAPRWYWSGGHMEAEVRKETERALMLAAPGPHAILLLVPVGQFTEVERRVPNELELLFGEGVLTHTLVLLTCGDYLMGRGEEQVFQGADPGLREVIDRCGGRYHVINNRRPQDREQVQTLLEKVENMVLENGGCYLQSVLQKEVEDRVKEIERELREKYRARLVEKEETFLGGHTTNAESERNGGGGEKSGHVRRQTGEERDEMEERVTVSSMTNGLHSTPSPQAQPSTQNGGTPWVQRSSSFRLTQEGALLSQLIEDAKPAKKVVNTFHHRITSSEDMADSAPPSSSVSSSSPSSPSSPSSFSSVFADRIRSLYTSPSSSRTSFHSSTPPAPSSPSTVSSSSFHSSTPPAPSSPSTVSSSSLHSSTPPAPSSPSTVSSSSLHSSTPPAPSSPSTVSSSTLSPLSSSSPLHSSSPPAPIFSSASSTSSPSFSPSSSSHSAELRLVLLGRSGAGKSSAGNAILGQELFRSRADSPTAVTEQCEKRRALVAGRQVAVVDTPADWFQVERPLEEARGLISSCVALAAPGPHAFLLCVPLHQPAQAELQTLRALETMFGPEAVSTYTLLLFTHSDCLREKVGPAGVEGYIASQRKDLLKLVERCGDRYHILERGRGGGEREGVAVLLEKVEQTVREGGGGCYTCPVFLEAERKVRQRQLEIAKERRGGRGAGQGGREESERRVLYPSMQTLRETEEEWDEARDEMDRTREEAERSVCALELENLPSLSSSSSSSSSISSSSLSFLRSVLEKVGAGAKKVPKLLAAGAMLGGAMGVFLGGPVGGAVGAATGSVITEVGRRKWSQKKTPALDTNTASLTETEKALDDGMKLLSDKVLKKD